MPEPIEVQRFFRVLRFGRQAELSLGPLWRAAGSGTKVVPRNPSVLEDEKGFLS